MAEEVRSLKTMLLLVQIFTFWRCCYGMAFEDARVGADAISEYINAGGYLGVRIDTIVIMLIFVPERSPTMEPFKGQP